MCIITPDGSCVPITPIPVPEPIRTLADIVALYAGAAIERLLMGIPGLF